MISDFVKGKKKFNYSTGIQQGITLHRAIDEFTDNHPATKSARKFFQPHYGLYSAVFMDVVYDHFLASDQQEFSDNSLMQFSQSTYEILNSYEPVFPDKFRSIYPYMKEYNWLYNYRNRLGIRRSFEGISYRALYMSESDTAYKLFNENYEALQDCYASFFPSLRNFAITTMKSLR
jgi:acyl carrier protein phosphodiesterase